MKSSIIKTIIGTIFVLIGVGLLVYPILTDYQLYTQQRQEVEEFLSHLAIKDDRNESSVNLQKEKVIGVIYIPKINVTLPIYPNVGEYAISNGVGLLPGTSKLTDAPSTHSVLSSHSGLSVNQLFSRLPELTKGDKWYVRTLDGKTLGYEVSDINTVEPYDTSKITINEGKTEMTLLTCTPIFINTHRLLVKGEYFKTDKEIEVKPYDILENNKQLLYLYGGFVLCVLIVIFCTTIFKRRSKSENKTI